jgi:hypothetical protein
MKEMFEASVDGQPYDNERWGNYYRPYGLEAPAGATVDKQFEATQASQPTTAPIAESMSEDDTSTSTPVVVPKATPSSDKAQDILAMIRSRQNKAA